MYELKYTHAIAADAEAAWRVFSDFGAFLDWNKLDMPMDVEGEGIGMVRTLVMGDIRVGERLDLKDDASRTLAYTLVEGVPIGMAEYEAQITIAPAPGGCELQWKGRFTAAEGSAEEEVATALQGSYAGMSTSLEAFLAGG